MATHSYAIADACPVCGAADRSDVERTPYRRCSGCGHHDAGERIASGSVINHALAAEAPAVSALEREQVRTLRGTGWTGAPVIDLGCGHGGFLHAVDVVAGLPVGSYGVEVTPESIEAARRWFGFELRSAVDAPSGPCVMTSWHSAEHIPMEVLRATLSTLRAEGTTIVISVPNAGSLQWRWFGRRWTYYDEGAHRSQFTPESLHTLLRQQGYSPVARPRMFLYEAFGALQTMVNLVRPFNRLYETLKRGRGSAPKGALLLDVAAAAVFAVPAGILTLAGLAWRDRASCVTAVYRPV